MKLFSRIIEQIGRVGDRLETDSLRVRLTVGIAAVSVLGLGSVAIWTGWKMQALLIDSHKQNLAQIADRFPRDVEIYSEMMAVEKGLPKAIDRLTVNKNLIWVKRPDGKILTSSQGVQNLILQSQPSAAAVVTKQQVPPVPAIEKIQNRYWVWCSSPLTVQGKNLGTLYVAHDITDEQVMFLAIVRSLGIASAIAILAITAAIALYIQRSLQPLRQLSQLAATVSAEDLGGAKLKLDRAPSEVRELAQMWDMMLHRLSSAWEQQRQFVSNVSHELRTPLTIVHGYLQSTLRRSQNLTELQKEGLEIAAAEADRTIRLLQDLLDLARADSGNLRLHLEPLVLNDLVAEVVGMGEQYSQGRIKVFADDKLIKVKADRDRLKQVLINLIDNALKYSSTTIVVKLSRQGDRALIQVADKGCGIPLTHQSRIFEPFYRVDSDRGRSTGGSGLGLSIVKMLVESMAGNVKVRSKIDVGSVFTVTLPAMPSSS
ncbi:MAG: HAMP domain-containing histidine kinase [Cyanosarcina radialis HA8281-LM2]|jgi:signal transduction histidine kinase|nr:HAMP domain-containing histidine kinase [Cyanosarcina radialis HA8281-LM2]